MIASTGAAPGPPVTRRARMRRLLGLLNFGGHTAVEAVRHNRLRAGLTSLGILFGVAAVIAMQAIGQGAQHEILQQMVLLGSNNVIITPIVAKPDEHVNAAAPKEARKFSPGLTYADAQAIARLVPAAELVGSEIVLNTTITRQQRVRPGKAVGVDTAYFRLTNLELERGNWFTPQQMEQGLPVAIIGSGVRVRFFTAESPIGKPIKVGGTWFTVVGVLADRRVDADAASQLGVRNANQDIYIPIRAMLLRLRDRARITRRDLGAGGGSIAIVNGSVVGGSGDDGDGDGGGGSGTKEQEAERANHNQLDRIIVRVADAKQVTPVVDVVHRMLNRRHNGVADFEVSVPELLLRQQQRTKTIFNVVLGAIASISLVVGGIGIMNIMLASVLERIREIGLRRALGATRAEILLQFLSEAVLISVAGGMAGILLGTALSVGIARFAGIKTLVSLSSVAVAFGVSVVVGIAFGVVPARRASEQDPIYCLRYE